MGGVRVWAAGAATSGEILESIRALGPCTRAELATRFGLSRPTVAARVDRLLQAGLLVQRAASSDRGRPPTLLGWNPLAGTALGIDLDREATRIVVADLQGDVLHRGVVKVKPTWGAERTLTEVTRCADDLITAAKRSRRDVWAVGIGVPGPVDSATGRIVAPAGMPSWDGVSVSALMATHWNAHVVVDNDMRMLAIAEAARDGGTHDDLILVKLGMGVGGAAISSGSVLSGSRGAAGEIGHVTVAGLNGLCRCGRVGCLETVASGWALMQELRDCGLRVDGLTDVVQLVKAGDPSALRAIRSAGCALGEVLGVLVNVLNPRSIVLGGELAGAGEPLFAGVREVLHQRVTPLAGGHLDLLRGGDDSFAGATGSVRAALDGCLAPASVDRFLESRDAA